MGELLGVSGTAIGDYKRRGVIADGQTALEWLQAIYRHLREQAAGRANSGALVLADERARLANEQWKVIELKRATIERTQAPVGLLTMALARATTQVVAALDTILPKIKQRAPDMPASALIAVEEVIANVRNVAAEVSIDISGTEDVPDNAGREDAA